MAGSNEVNLNESKVYVYPLHFFTALFPSSYITILFFSFAYHFSNEDFGA